tara:strand:+ start:425 stop:922 length:498 start_codon:yes stop_codon:yes gene_type:complete
MAFTDSPISYSNIASNWRSRVEKKQEVPDIWTPAIAYADSTAWYYIQCIMLESNGVDIDDERSNLTEKFATLWEHNQDAIEARGCDLNDIDLLEGYKGEIPPGKDGKPCARFTMIGVLMTPRYREAFIAYLKKERIPDNLVLLAFPARRGIKDGKFNLKFTFDSK